MRAKIDAQQVAVVAAATTAAEISAKAIPAKKQAAVATTCSANQKKKVLPEPPAKARRLEIMGLRWLAGAGEVSFYFYEHRQVNSRSA